MAQATQVATAMKENGWEFASHTWGHINVGERSLETLMTDTEKWLTYVAPIVGNTDKIIFAFGADITGVDDYTGHPKFDYLKARDLTIFVMSIPANTGFNCVTTISGWGAETWMVTVCITIRIF